MTDWQVKQSRIVFKDKWVTLRADDCLTPSGVEVAPYYLLEYPDWVHVVAIDTDDQVILVQQYRHGYGGVTLELPGGVMDPTDSSPAETAARELAEETGYTASSFQSLVSLSPNPATHTNRVHVVLAKPVHLSVPSQPDPEENIVVVRLPVQDALRMALKGEVVHAQHVGLLAIGLQAAGVFNTGEHGYLPP